MTSTLEVLDCNNNSNGGVLLDFKVVADDGILIACPKYTEGGTTGTAKGYQDPHSLAHRYGALMHLDGRVAPYHWLRPDNGRGFPLGDPRSAINEATWYLDAIGEFGPKERPAFDFEQVVGVPSYLDLTVWLQAACQTVIEQTSKRPIIYTYASYWYEHIASDWFAANCDLWLAAYQDAEPTPLRPWDHVSMWQYTSVGTLPGLSGHFDLSHFYGTLSDWDASAAKTQTPVVPPTPPEETVLHSHAMITIGHDRKGSGVAVVPFTTTPVNYDSIVSYDLATNENGTVPNCRISRRPGLNNMCIFDLHGDPGTVKVEVVFQ